MLTDQLCEVLLQESLFAERLQDSALHERLKAHVEELLAVSQYMYKQLLLSPGQPAEHVYFVQEGFARGFFYEDKSQRQVTLFLWDRHSIIAAANSFFLQQPADIYIEVMPGTVLLSLSQRQVSEIFQLFPDTQLWGHLLTLRYMAFHKQRTLDLLTRSAWERYLDLLEAYPQIEQKVSKDIIASYLGITPQSLSRLIKEKGHP